MSEPTSCCRAAGGYCDRCDLLVGPDGLHVVGVDRDEGGALTVTVESAPEPMGCRSCGVIAHAHGRVEVRLVDAPAMGRPVRIRWRKRRWVCPDPGCPVGSFVEQHERVVAPRAVLTTRACRWAIEQIRRERASVNGIRRQLGTGWRTVWAPHLGPRLDGHRAGLHPRGRHRAPARVRHPTLPGPGRRRRATTHPPARPAPHQRQHRPGRRGGHEGRLRPARALADVGHRRPVLPCQRPAGPARSREDRRGLATLAWRGSFPVPSPTPRRGLSDGP